MSGPNIDSIASAPAAWINACEFWTALTMTKEPKQEMSSKKKEFVREKVHHLVEC